MKPEDFTPVLDESGQMIGRRVRSVSGKEYVIGEKRDAGGAAAMFHATKDGDSNSYWFREYVTTPDLRVRHETIKRNIRNIMVWIDSLENHHMNEKLWLHFYALPLDLVELNSGGFGYIMNKIDSDKYKPARQIINHPEDYPDAKILYKFCKNFAELFEVLNLAGLRYNDLNEDKVYINPDDGDFFIVDADDICVVRYDEPLFLLGKTGYTAPEVYITGKQNRLSDYFSIATFFFRLFIGSYPMDGPATERYMTDNDLTVDDAAPIIYGSEALFAFHPTDKRNAVYAVEKNEDYFIQTQKWNALPIQIQECMIQTFVNGLHEDIGCRTTYSEWKTCFEYLENQIP